MNGPSAEHEVRGTWELVAADAGQTVAGSFDRLNEQPVRAEPLIIRCAQKSRLWFCSNPKQKQPLSV